MRRWWIGGVAVVAAAALLLSGCSGDDHTVAAPARAATSVGPGEGHLRLLAMSGYVESGRSDPRVDWVTPFTKRTGCKVTVGQADTPQQLRSLAESDDYDGIVADPGIAGKLIADHRVAPINTKLIKRYSDLSTWLRGLPGTRAGHRRYGLPYTWSTATLLYDADKVSPGPRGWAALFAPRHAAKRKGHMVMADTPMSIALAALYLKRQRPELKITDPYELSTAQFDAAVAVLDKQRPLVQRYWKQSADVIEAFTAGDTVLGQGDPYHLDVLSRAGRPIEDATPSSGTTGSVDSWLISAQAPHPNCMYQWLDWSIASDVQAQLAEWMGSAPANPDACDHLGRGFCDAYHVDDPDYVAKVKFAHRPSRNCGATDGTKTGGKSCVGYATWRDRWQKITDG